MDLLSPERQAYYKAKKREELRTKEAKRIIREDATYIYYYGMSAFLELFPEARGFGINWHKEIISELQRIERVKLADKLSGTASAYGAVQSKKGNRAFSRLIRHLQK